MSTLFAAAHSHLILKRLRNTTNDDVNYENIKNVSLDLHTISHTKVRDDIDNRVHEEYSENWNVSFNFRSPI